jgi:threonyl-tRNA synthetase
MLKVPYFLIIGDLEVKSNNVSVRQLDGKDLGLMELQRFEDLLYQSSMKKCRL